MARTLTSVILGIVIVAMLAFLSPAMTQAQDIDRIDRLNRQVVELLDQGRYTDAAMIAEVALTLAENSLGREHRTTLASVDGHAGVLYGQRRYGDAGALFKRSLEARERVLGREHPDTLRTLVNLASVYQADGRLSEAEPLYTSALEAYERILGKDHPNTLHCVTSLSSLYRTRGDRTRAAAFLKRSIIGLVERSLRDAQQSAGTLDRKSTHYAAEFRTLIKQASDLVVIGHESPTVALQEQFQTAQWALGSDAAQSLAQMAMRGAGGNPQLAPLVRERQDLVAEWQRRETLWNADLGQQVSNRHAEPEAENNNRMVAIDKRIAEIEKKLEAEFPDYTALASPAPLSVDAVQTLIGADEALVLFLDIGHSMSTREETFIWVVTKAAVRWVRSKLGTAELTREVQALRCGLDEEEWVRPTSVGHCMDLLGLTKQPDSTLPLPFDLGRAHRLYKSLFGQVEDLIRDKQLLIVPSGALTQLPFHALVTASPTSGNYRFATWLARGHALSVLPAVASLKARRPTERPSAATKPLIGFGNPLLNGPDDRHAGPAKLAREKLTCPKSPWPRMAALSGPRHSVTPIETRGGLANVSLLRELTPLPETAGELCSVASDIGAGANEVRLGARATEHDIKAMSDHGELAKYRALHFATHCALAGELSKGVEPGLVLTPPLEASAADDGYLSGSEIASLKLDADWVILSACNTAAGDAASAEALSGLARAFIYAQARTLLVSHWAGNSDATVKLIASAMHEVARDKTVGRAEGLRRAMLALIDKGEPHEAHPAYWAPFIVVGEGAR